MKRLELTQLEDIDVLHAQIGAYNKICSLENTSKHPKKKKERKAQGKYAFGSKLYQNSTSSGVIITCVFPRS